MKKIISTVSCEKEFEREFKKGGLAVLIEKNSELKVDLSDFQENFNLVKIKKRKRKVVFTKKELFFLKEAFIRLIEDVEFYLLSEFDFNKLTEDICLVGLYEDIPSNVFVQLQNEKKYKVEFMIGRDICSLTWMITKQFFSVKSNKKLIILGNPIKFLEYKKLKEILGQDYEILLARDLKKESIIQNLRKEVYKNLIIFGHGKDDHINIDKYTICGLSKSSGIDSDEKLSPICKGNSDYCFKDPEKLIQGNTLKVESVVLASCNSGSNFKMGNYSKNFNLTLNFIDGYPNTIIASNSDTRFGFEEILAIIKNPEILESNIINYSLFRQQPLVTFYNISVTDKDVLPSNYWCVNDRLKNYSNLKKHIYELSENKILALSENTRKSSKELIEKISKNSPIDIESLDKEIITVEKEIIKESISDYEKIGDLGTRIISNKNFFWGNPIEESYCRCGLHKYKYFLNSINQDVPNYQEYFCYKCGEVGFKYGEINVNIKSFKMTGKKHLLNFEVITNESNSIIWGLLFPNYLKEYLKKDYQIFVDKIQDKNKGKEISVIIEYKDDVPCQNHYFSLYVMSNFNLYSERIVFQIS